MEIIELVNNGYNKYQTQVKDVSCDPGLHKTFAGFFRTLCTGWST